MTLNPAIYEMFLRRGAAYRFAGLWHHVMADPDGRACPDSGTASLAELTENFTDRELLASGVAQELPDGLVMNGALVGGAQGVIALRAIPDDPPYGLVTSDGIVPHELSPAAAIMRDHWTQELLQARGPALYVAFTLVDVLLLRAAGFPTALAADFFLPIIDRLPVLAMACGWFTPTDPQPEGDGAADLPERGLSTGAGMERAVNAPEVIQLGEPSFSAAGVAIAAASSDAVEPSNVGDAVNPAPETTGQSNAMARDAVDIVLVGWSPTSLCLEPPEGCAKLISELLFAERNLGIDVSRVAVWQPAPEELAALRLYLETGSVGGAFGVLCRSAGQHLFTLDTANRRIKAHGRPPTSFIETQRELNTCLADRQDAANLSAAWAAYERAVDRDLYEPLCRQALADEDASRRSSGMIEAQLARTFHLAAPQVQPTVRRGARGRSAEETRVDVGSLLQIVKYWIAIYQARNQ